EMTKGKAYQDIIPNHFRNNRADSIDTLEFLFNRFEALRNRIELTLRGAKGYEKQEDWDHIPQQITNMKKYAGMIKDLWVDMAAEMQKPDTKIPKDVKEKFAAFSENYQELDDKINSLSMKYAISTTPVSNTDKKSLSK